MSPLLKANRIEITPRHRKVSATGRNPATGRSHSDCGQQTVAFRSVAFGHGTKPAWTGQAAQRQRSAHVLADFAFGPGVAFSDTGDRGQDLAGGAVATLNRHSLLEGYLDFSDSAIVRCCLSTGRYFIAKFFSAGSWPEVASFSKSATSFW